MKRAIAWLKNIRPVKILTVLLAGMFLFLTQACNRPDIAGQPPQPPAQPPQSYTQQRYDPTKDYPLSSPRDGINNFSDVDPRGQAGEKAASDRADALAKNSKRNVDEKGVKNPTDIIDNVRRTPVGEKVKDLGESIGGSAEELGEGVAKGTKRGIENIKSNTQNATEDVTTTVKRGAEDAGSAVNNTIRNAS